MDVLKKVYETAGLDYDQPESGRSLDLPRECWAMLDLWHHEYTEDH